MAGASELDLKGDPKMILAKTGLATPKHTRGLLTAAAFVALLGTSFASSSYAQSHEEDNAGEEIHQPATLAVQIQSGKFSETKLTVHVGDTVVWTNTTTIKHTVTADATLAKNAADIILPAGADPFNSGLISPGQTFSHTFSVAGIYQYVCLPHELHGMMAQVEVLP